MRFVQFHQCRGSSAAACVFDIPNKCSLSEPIRKVHFKRPLQAPKGRTWTSSRAPAGAPGILDRAVSAHGADVAHGTLELPDPVILANPKP